MLEDMGNPSPSAVGNLLGVHERTAYRWQAKDEAPRAALLALFWETSWGRQWVHAITFNEARAQAQLAESRLSTIERLERRIAYLERVGQYGSANAPTFTPAPFWPGFEGGPRLATSNGITTG